MQLMCEVEKIIKHLWTPREPRPDRVALESYRTFKTRISTANLISRTYAKYVVLEGVVMTQQALSNWRLLHTPRM